MPVDVIENDGAADVLTEPDADTVTDKELENEALVDAVTESVHDKEDVLLAETDVEPVIEVVAVLETEELLDIEREVDALAEKVADNEGTGDRLEVQVELSDKVTEVVMELDTVAVWDTDIDFVCDAVMDPEAVEVIVGVHDIDIVSVILLLNDILADMDTEAAAVDEELEDTAALPEAVTLTEELKVELRDNVIVVLTVFDAVNVHV